MVDKKRKFSKGAEEEWHSGSLTGRPDELEKKSPKM
jgi:hypothetical protein